MVALATAVASECATAWPTAYRGFPRSRARTSTRTAHWLPPMDPFEVATASTAKGMRDNDLSASAIAAARSVPVPEKDSIVPRGSLMGMETCTLAGSAVWASSTHAVPTPMRPTRVNGPTSSCRPMMSPMSPIAPNDENRITGALCDR